MISANELEQQFFNHFNIPKMYAFLVQGEICWYENLEDGFDDNGCLPNEEYPDLSPYIILKLIGELTHHIPVTFTQNDIEEQTLRMCLNIQCEYVKTKIRDIVMRKKKAC